MIVYVSIGNSDDKLTQNEWSLFTAAVDLAVRRACSLEGGQIHGAWYSLPTDRWQNACWCFEPPVNPVSVEHLRMRLSEVAIAFGQDSIAWAEAPVTRFLSGLSEGAKRHG